MTPRELAERLIESRKGVTPDRLARAQARAKQFGIEWSAVLETLEPHERAQVEQAS